MALIQVNRQRITTTDPEMTGAQLCGLAGASPNDVDLWRIAPLGMPDERIEADQVVEMFDGLRVFTAPKLINNSANDGQTEPIAKAIHDADWDAAWPWGHSRTNHRKYRQMAAAALAVRQTRQPTLT